jgi:putative hydrolase of the HAD superfamily
LQKSGRLNLKGILIDFGDTVGYIDHDENGRYERALLSIVRRYGYRKSLGELSSSLGKAYWKSNKGEIRDFQEFWEMFLKDLGVPKSPAVIENLQQHRIGHYSTIFKLYEGTISVLTILRRKYRLALVSNCAVGLSDVLQTLDLERFFECIVLSYEIGVRKPDRRIYLEALQRLKLRSDECIFVADEISDLEGAREVGLETMLVRQGPHTTHEAKNRNFKPNFECNSISEITRFL